MFSYVVAVSRNNVIGKDGRLPWHLPGDMHFFKEITMTGTRTMIMGRKTFESLPRVLPGRKHIVFSRNESYRIQEENVEVVHSLDDLLPLARAQEEYFVIGGEQIFKVLFPHTERLYLTLIHEDFEGDTFFPDYEPTEWQVCASREGKLDEANPLAHTFLVLDRKK